MRFKPYSFTIDKGMFGLKIVFGLPVTFTADAEKLMALSNSGLELELKAIRQKRSLDANSYLWVLCDEIADVIRSTKEEIYRTAITEVGSFIEMAFTSEKDMDDFQTWWSEKGLGWIVEVVDKESMIVHAYIGSSRYDTKQMSRLIDHVVAAAKEMGIETLTPEELERMKDDWRKH